MRLTIRNKLILYTVLPVLAVYSLLSWLGISHIRDHLRDEARQLLVEHARHQASRLALVMSPAPGLAESLGDLALAEPELPQTLIYAHLIDGLRRTPIAKAAAVELSEEGRGALMRRGEAAGQPLTVDSSLERYPGWRIEGDMLRLERPIRREGRRIGSTWVDVAIGDLYAEIERLRSPGVRLFVSGTDGLPLRTGSMSPQDRALLELIPADRAIEEVQRVTDEATGDAYWVVSVDLPDFPWRVTAVTATRDALAPARDQATLVATGLLLSLVAIVAIIGTVARQITRPLETLDHAVQQIAHGDFSVAPEVRSDDELGGLARAIRRMAGHISERERQLRRSHQVLEQRVNERTAELQNSNARLTRQIEETHKTEEALRLANAQAQQANRAKSEFLSNMSHELRTPLHGVLGYTQILLRDSAADDSQRESLEAIERCGQHLLTLINDILDLTKIEAGQMQVDMQPTDLSQLLEDVHMIIAQRAVAKGLELRLDLAGDLPQAILTDPVKLKQILLNLLGNAVKFTSRGSVTLSVTVPAQDQLAFEVSDTGVGIPADKVDSIFDAFHQAREGRPIDGTGLGLAINQRLISLLGGEPLSVESTPGAGSRFRFRIPVRPLPAESLGRPRDASQRRSGRMRLAAGDSCRLMVVDALAENRNVVSRLLDYTDCDVEGFSDLVHARQRLGEKAFDIVLFDVRLLDASIAEQVDGLRRSAAFAPPHLVAVSANVFPGAARSARQVGFDAFLAKPFSEQQLLTLISELVGVSFEARPEQAGDEAPMSAQWPAKLAHATASRIREAVDLGDVASLFQLAEELAEDPKAPREDVDNMALMARLFDFDGLRHLSERLYNAG